MRNLLIALFVLSTPVAFAQTSTIDLGPGVSTLLRYRVFPHLQRGLEAAERGDETAAIAEMERARSLAPDNAVIAVHLAQVYVKFGRVEQARALLQDQLSKTPHEARLSEALAALAPAVEAVPTATVVAPKPTTSSVVAAAPAPPPADRAAELRRETEARRRAEAERQAARIYAERAQAYREHEQGNYAAALALWGRQPVAELVADDLLGAATTAIAAGAPRDAEQWLSAYRDRGFELSHRYWSVTADAVMDSDPVRATAALAQAIATTPEASDYLRMARLEPLAERRLAWLRRGAALGDATASTHAAVGFAAWNAGHPVEAEQAFERAWQLDRNSVLVASQLVYVHQRLANNDRARWFAAQVIDALDAEPATAAADGATLPERRFGFARLHEDLGRRLTLSLDGFSGSGAASATSVTGPGRAFRSFAQAEADLRLGRTPIRDGSTLSLYLRVFADGGPERLAVPTANATLGAGLRWKPIGNRILFVMAEAQQTPATGSHDLVVRSSMSLFNGGRWSDDWHPTGRGWASRNLYLDAAYYVVGEQIAVAGDYRMSYHRRVGGRQTLESFARLQVNGFRTTAFQRDVRVGIGARWNLWSGESRYDAFRHKLSAGVEFQRALDTYMPGRNGVFVNIGVRR